MHVRNTLALKYLSESLFEVLEVLLAFIQFKLEHSLAEFLLLTISSQFLRLIVELGNVVVNLNCVDGTTALLHDTST